MSTLRICLLLYAVVLWFANSANAQSTLAYEDGTAYRSAKSAAASIPSPSHANKKLPSFYQGYAIEVASSTYPLDRSNPIFKKFGNIHYDKLDRGSYSYLILGRFSDDKSALHFLNNVIVAQVSDARVVHYKDGIRKIVRVE